MTTKISLFSWLKEKLFSTPNAKSRSKLPKAEDRYILVLSGGGTRGFYHGGILKALEEC
jgi:predicted acylesterase/phospholipase RssA